MLTITFERDSNRTIIKKTVDGEIPSTVRKVYAQHRNGTDEEWIPGLGRYAPISRKTVLSILDGAGPFIFNQYRFVPVIEEEEKEKNREKFAELQKRNEAAVLRSPNGLCLCGCGQSVTRQYVRGHGRRGRKFGK